MIHSFAVLCTHRRCRQPHLVALSGVRVGNDPAGTIGRGRDGVGAGGRRRQLGEAARRAPVLPVTAVAVAVALALNT